MTVRGGHRETRCISKDTDFSMVEGTSMDPINLNKEFIGD